MEREAALAAEMSDRELGADTNLSDQELGANAHLNKALAAGKDGKDSDTKITLRTPQSLAWLVSVGCAVTCATLALTAWTSHWRPPPVLGRPPSAPVASHLDSAQHPLGAMLATSFLPQPLNPPSAPTASPKPNHPIQPLSPAPAVATAAPHPHSPAPAPSAAPQARSPAAALPAASKPSSLLAAPSAAPKPNHTLGAPSAAIQARSPAPAPSTVPHPSPAPAPAAPKANHTSGAPSTAVQARSPAPAPSTAPHPSPAPAPADTMPSAPTTTPWPSTTSTPSTTTTTTTTPRHPMPSSFRTPLFPSCKPGQYPPGFVNDMQQNPYEVAPIAGAPHVVLAIFSGRADRMRVLLGYASALKQAGRLQEVHMWDRRGGSDTWWLEKMSRSRGYRLLPMLGGWLSFYSFYATFSIPGIAKNRVVIVKCDDDVVFVDQSHFSAYVNYTAHRQDLLMVQANVVNNGVAAWYQFHRNPLKTSYLAPHLNAYPPGGKFGPIWGPLNATTDKAYALHKLFLNNPSAFSWSDPENGDCINYRPPGWCAQARFSINFFAARLAVWPLLVKLVQKAGGDDEAGVTTVANNMGHRQCMYTPFNVVHLSFMRQWQNLQLLPEYVRLAQRQGLALPDDPGPWCDGILRGDRVQDNLEVKTGVSMTDCKARCKADGRCAGLAYVRKGCGLATDTCWLKKKVLPLSGPGSGCHCLLVKGMHFS